MSAEGAQQSSQEVESLAFLLNSANLSSDAGPSQHWITQTDILTTDNLDFDGAFGSNADKAANKGPPRELGAEFLDSAQDLESVYSSHMSSCQDLMSSLNSAADPAVLFNTDPMLAPSGRADGPLEPVSRSLSASLAQEGLGEGGAGPASGHRGAHGHLKDGASPRKHPQRGQGYRRLWQQVTKVSKGQKLQDNLGLAFSDMTVEDLLKIVLKLAPQVSDGLITAFVTFMH